MRFPAKLPPDQSCPDCGSRAKRLPPTRSGQSHVFCSECGYDFGRFDSMSRQVLHILDELELKLGISSLPSSYSTPRQSGPRIH